MTPYSGYAPSSIEFSLSLDDRRHELQIGGHCDGLLQDSRYSADTSAATVCPS